MHDTIGLFVDEIHWHRMYCDLVLGKSTAFHLILVDGRKVPGKVINDNSGVDVDKLLTPFKLEILPAGIEKVSSHLNILTWMVSNFHQIVNSCFDVAALLHTDKFGLPLRLKLAILPYVDCHLLSFPLLSFD